LVNEESLEESKLYAPVKTIAPAVLPSIIRGAKERDLMNEENDFFGNEKEEV
jgi:membrane protein required for colicin V production